MRSEFARNVGVRLITRRRTAAGQVLMEFVSDAGECWHCTTRPC
jgi:hypothetical protein